ncbi:MAG: polysaccharide deacetylase family protein [Clostridiales bacterium]|nr:polysaccharide deacetylase family protein [Clostridiales bacterium]
MISFDVFKDGKRNALTMSYDDGTIYDIKLIEIFNKHGIKSTFHLNSGRFGVGRNISEKDIADLYKNHEISVHGVLHKSLAKLPLQNIIPEIFEDRKNLEKICGYPVRGMSFANGSYNKGVISALKFCGIEYARTTKATKAFELPEDFLEWHPTCHHNDAVEMGRKFLEQKRRQGKLLYVWGHSYEFNDNNNWDLIEEFCRMFAKEDDIWFATNIEIYDYITAQRNLKISADNSIVYNPSCQAVWFTVEGEIFKINGGETLHL